MEETLVRDKACPLDILSQRPSVISDASIQADESITKVATVLIQQQIEQYYIPLLERLSRGEWFTSRTSSAALYAPVYAKVSTAIQDGLRKGYLAADDTPMVRRAAAKWLGVRVMTSIN